MNNVVYNKSAAEKVILRVHDKLWDVNSYLVIPTLIMLEREYSLKNLAYHPTWDIKEHVLKMLNEYPPYSKPQLAEAYKILAKSFNSLNSEQVKQAIYILTELPIVSISDEDFAQLFFISLKFTHFKKRSGEINTPNEIIEVMTSLYNLKTNSKVYNPFGGYASFSNYFNKDEFYTGEEINQQTWALAILNLESQKRGSYQYRLANSITEWNNNQFDLIISNPPFGLRINSDEANSPYRELESFIADKSISQLGKDGKAIFLLPLGFLFKGTNTSLRKKLIDNDLIEFVIELPAGLFEPFTSIHVFIIGINKNPKRKGGTTFINAKDYIVKDGKSKYLDSKNLLNLIQNEPDSKVKRWVSAEEISLNDYNLNANRYFVKSLNKPSTQLVTLSEICLPISQNGSVKEGSEGRFVRIRDLKNSPINGLLENDQLEYMPIPKNAYNLTEDALLIALRGNLLKPTLIGMHDSDIAPIYVTNDILALSINEERIHPSYLLFQLHSDFVLKQLEAYRYGTTITTISKKDLLHVKIELPPLEEQKSITLKLFQKAFFPKEAEKQREIQKIKEEILEDLRIKKHNLSQHLNDVKSSISALVKFIEKSKGTINNNDLISVKRNITVKDHLAMSYDAVIRLGGLLEKITNDEVFNSPEIINIDTCLKTLKDSYMGKDNFEFEYFFDEQTFRCDKSNDPEVDFFKPLVKIAELDLRELFYNIVDNAKNHGFIKGHTNYLIKIDVLYSPETEMIHVNFSNNGKPFPSGMDEKRYFMKGEKAGVSGNTGYGGYRIKAIVEHYNGNVELLNDPNSDFPVTISLKFPIIFNSDEV